MDLNGDGIADIISGDYDSGCISYFEGTRTGFKAKTVIREERPPAAATLKTLVMSRLVVEDRAMGTASFVDWDGDGDVDLIVGNGFGGITLNVNKGTRTVPTFGARVPLLVDGKPMRVIQKSDPAPVDWDGDGILDIVAGDEAGGLTFFKGRRDRTFDAGRSLFTGRNVPSVEQDYDVIEDWWKKDRGWDWSRIRICVVDWDNDGRLEVLVGYTGFNGKPSGIAVLRRK